MDEQLRHLEQLARKDQSQEPAYRAALARFTLPLEERIREEQTRIRELYATMHAELKQAIRELLAQLPTPPTYEYMESYFDDSYVTYCLRPREARGIRISGYIMDVTTLKIRGLDEKGDPDKYLHLALEAYRLLRKKIDEQEG